MIKFAVIHKKPLKKSAFTYCDEEIPSRIDYGKQRYGGPFTTEQVEDVKVLLRIVLVLVTRTQVKYFYASGSSPQSSVHSFYSANI